MCVGEVRLPTPLHWRSVFLAAIVWACSTMVGQAQRLRRPPDELEQLDRSAFDSMIEQGVYGRESRSGRGCWEADAEQVISFIDRECRLTAEQKQRLQLAARGDINRFLGRLDLFKEEYWLRTKGVFKNGQRFDEITPLRFSVMAGLFHDGSLLRKSVANVLTAEQVVRYKEALHEHDLAAHAKGIRRFVDHLERLIGGRLPESRRRQFAALVEKEIKPSPCHGSEGLEGTLHYFFFGLDRIPEEKLKRLFSDAEWQKLNWTRAQVRLMEPMLRQAGILPTEHE